MESEEIEGWMEPEELEWLFDRAKEMKSIIEIGCWKGRSTHALLSGCKGPVFAVDHFKGSPDEINAAHAEALDHDIYEDFKKNVGHFKNLLVMRMPSVVACQWFRDRSIDMVFIDGCHLEEFSLQDMTIWKRVCRRLLCGHDKGQDGVPQALNESGLKYYDAAESIWAVDL